MRLGKITLLMFTCTICLYGCGKHPNTKPLEQTNTEVLKNETNISIADAETILGGEATASVSDKAISFVTKYACIKDDIDDTIAWCKDNGFSEIDMEIHGKNGIGYCSINNNSEQYHILYNDNYYSSYKEDFYRISESQHPYLISQEASDLLYLDYHLTDSKFYNEYTYSPDGYFVYYIDTEKEFFNILGKSLEIATALFNADENIKDIIFQLRDSYYSAHYIREEDGSISNENVDDFDSIEPQNQSAEQMSPSDVDPSDIHSYVSCGEIVQYSPLTDDGDFGDVELETVVDERYVTIYSAGTYYYMLDYMNNMITIAYME